MKINKIESLKYSAK